VSNLSYNGFLIYRNKNTGLVSLTDMWRAHGSLKTKEVDQWLRQERVCDLLLQFVAETRPELNPVLNRVLKAKPSAGSGMKSLREWTSQVKQLAVRAGLITLKSGKGGGTHGSPKVAIAYAEDLSPSFHSWALTAIEERIEEENDPEKSLSRGYERAVRGWKGQGYSDADIDVLAQCVIARKDLTGTLTQHGVKEGVPSWVINPYANVTNELYKPLLPGTATDYRQRHNLPSKANVREHLTQTGEMTKRAAIMLAETMARETIKDENRHGFIQCKDACGQAGKRVARVFDP
jgi:hypothetical protein